MKAALPRWLLLLAALVAVAGCNEDAPAGEAVTVPSGRELSLIEIVTNAPGPAGATARFRFLAPGLSPDDAEAAAADMQAVCDSFAISRIDGMVPAPQQIVISFASEAVPFGEAAPEVVQFFESYRPDGAACVWEVF
ncbi:MAG: acetolactate synthase [Acetobacteraceae bacterium]|nr:MAG: acetolactate synthase [Acetobacteraceae bacterium]